MGRPPKLLAGALAMALTGTAVAPPLLAAAATPAPQPVAQTAGLLDGITGTLGSLLGGVLGGSQPQLQQLLGSLQQGQQPTGAALAPLQALLGQVAATPGLPASTKSLITQVNGLLGSAADGQPLAPGALAPVATLLHSLAATDGVPAGVASLLGQLASQLSSGAAGLPIGQLSLDPGSVSGLTNLLTALANGQQPTGALLAPVTPLLDQVAGTPGLPAALSQLIEQLSATIKGTTGALDPLVSDELSTVLSLIGNTPGVPADTRTIIERTSTMISSQSSTSSSTSSQSAAAQRKAAARVATARDRAVIERVRVNKARTIVAARIACPHVAPAVCATTVTVHIGRATAARGKRVRIGQGNSKVVRFRLLRAAHTTAVRHGGRLGVTVVTTFGSRHFSVQRSLALKRVVPSHRR